MKSIGSTGLAYLWGKVKSIFATKTELAEHPTGRIYYGACSTTANTYVKEATVETFPLDANDKPLVGTVVAIKFTVSNTYKTEGQTYALNVNNTGEYPMYYNNAAVATSTSANTLVAGYKNRHVFYVFNGTQWVWLSASYDTNTTYSGMTQAEIDAGTSTTARLITPARLMDNFYTEGEVDTLLADKADSADLSDVAFSGSYNDLENTPTIPTVPSNVSAFNNDAGYITGYTETDPVFAASAAHGISSSDIANWNGKQAAIDDLATIRSGAALGATALQSFTESDPTVPAWAKASTKPSYTASEVGALPDSTTIPSASTATPQMDGTGAAGSASTYAKGDHVHPTDTSRKPAVTEVSHGTSSTTFALTPNVLHTWGTVSSLNLTLGSGSATYVDEYMFKFTAGTGFTLTLPSTVEWYNEPQFNEGKTYEVSIVDGYACSTADIDMSAYAKVSWVTTQLELKPASSTIDNIVTLTEAQYTALSTKDSSTLYIITA